jgi:hypothetical protein
MLCLQIWKDVDEETFEAHSKEVKNGKSEYHK